MDASQSLADQRTVYAIVKYLKDASQQCPTNEALPLAIQSLAQAYHVDLEDPQVRRFLDAGIPLDEIVSRHFAAKMDPVESESGFQCFLRVVQDKGYFRDAPPGSLQYCQKYEALLEKYKSSHSPSSSPAPVAVPAEPPADPNVFKEQGNRQLAEHDYLGAYESYSRALQVADPAVHPCHVFYSNRAAALIFLNRFPEAIDDCQHAIEINPSFIRPYKRLCSVYRKQNNPLEALRILEKAHSIDANDAEITQWMEELRQDAPYSQPVASQPLPSPSAPPQAPGAAAASPFGGMDFGSILQDPSFMQTATNLMSSPGFQNIMSGLMGQFGGGAAGGSPFPSVPTESPHQSTPSASAPAAPASPAAPAAPPAGGLDMSLIRELMKPETLQKLRNHPRIQELLSDPSVGGIFQTILTNPMSALQYLSNPLVQAKLPIILQAVQEVTHS